jgi:uncharacterized MAPEG superfamily protein
MTQMISPEMHYLFWAIVLGLVQLLLAILSNVSGHGTGWALGPRDDGRPALPKYRGRIERAWFNFVETFPFFAAAVLAASALNMQSATTALGAALYFWARVAYVPAYVISIPLLRTLIWLVSLAGIVIILCGLWPGW